MMHMLRACMLRVGGGFNEVETVGELNHFVRESIARYYKNIYMSDVRVLLVSASDKILEQIDERLSNYALQKLKQSGASCQRSYTNYRNIR